MTDRVKEEPVEDSSDGFTPEHLTWEVIGETNIIPPSTSSSSDSDVHKIEPQNVPADGDSWIKLELPSSPVSANLCEFTYNVEVIEYGRQPNRELPQIKQEPVDTELKACEVRFEDGPNQEEFSDNDNDEFDDHGNFVGIEGNSSNDEVGGGNNIIVSEVRSGMEQVEAMLAGDASKEMPSSRKRRKTRSYSPPGIPTKKLRHGSKKKKKETAKMAPPKKTPAVQATEMKQTKKGRTEDFQQDIWTEIPLSENASKKEIPLAVNPSSTEMSHDVSTSRTETLQNVNQSRTEIPQNMTNTNMHRSRTEIRTDLVKSLTEIVQSQSVNRTAPPSSSTAQIRFVDSLDCVPTSSSIWAANATINGKPVVFVEDPTAPHPAKRARSHNPAERLNCGKVTIVRNIFKGAVASTHPHPHPQEDPAVKINTESESIDVDPVEYLSKIDPPDPAACEVSREYLTSKSCIVYPRCPCSLPVSAETAPGGVAHLMHTTYLHFMNNRLVAFIHDGKPYISELELRALKLLPWDSYEFDWRALGRTHIKGEIREESEVEKLLLRRLYPDSLKGVRRLTKLLTPYALSYVCRNKGKNQLYPANLRSLFYLQHLTHTCPWTLLVTPMADDSAKTPLAKFQLSSAVATKTPFVPRILASRKQRMSSTQPHPARMKSSATKALVSVLEQFDLAGLVEPYCNCEISVAQLASRPPHNVHEVGLQRQVFQLVFINGKIVHCWLRPTGVYISVPELKMHGLLPRKNYVVEDMLLAGRYGIERANLAFEEIMFLKALANTLTGELSAYIINVKYLRTLYSVLAKMDKQWGVHHKAVFCLKLFEHGCCSNVNDSSVPDDSVEMGDKVNKPRFDPNIGKAFYRTSIRPFPLNPSHAVVSITVGADKHHISVPVLSTTGSTRTESEMIAETKIIDKYMSKDDIRRMNKNDSLNVVGEESSIAGKPDPGRREDESSNDEIDFHRIVKEKIYVANLRKLLNTKEESSAHGECYPVHMKESSSTGKALAGSVKDKCVNADSSLTSGFIKKGSTRSESLVLDSGSGRERTPKAEKSFADHGNSTNDILKLNTAESTVHGHGSTQGKSSTANKSCVEHGSMTDKSLDGALKTDDSGQATVNVMKRIVKDGSSNAETYITVQTTGSETSSTKALKTNDSGQATVKKRSVQEGSSNAETSNSVQIPGSGTLLARALDANDRGQTTVTKRVQLTNTVVADVVLPANNVNPTGANSVQGAITRLKITGAARRLMLPKTFDAEITPDVHPVNANACSKENPKVTTVVLEPELQRGRTYTCSTERKPDVVLNLHHEPRIYVTVTKRVQLTNTVVPDVVLPANKVNPTGANSVQRAINRLKLTAAARRLMLPKTFVAEITPEVHPVDANACSKDNPKVTKVVLKPQLQSGRTYTSKAEVVLKLLHKPRISVTSDRDRDVEVPPTKKEADAAFKMKDFACACACEPHSGPFVRWSMHQCLVSSRQTDRAIFINKHMSLAVLLPGELDMVVTTFRKLGKLYFSVAELEKNDYFWRGTHFDEFPKVGPEHWFLEADASELRMLKQRDVPIKLSRYGCNLISAELLCHLTRLIGAKAKCLRQADITILEIGHVCPDENSVAHRVSQKPPVSVLAGLVANDPVVRLKSDLDEQQREGAKKTAKSVLIKQSEKMCTDSANTNAEIAIVLRAFTYAGVKALRVNPPSEYFMFGTADEKSESSSLGDLAEHIGKHYVANMKSLQRKVAVQISSFDQDTPLDVMCQTQRLFEGKCVLKSSKWNSEENAEEKAKEDKAEKAKEEKAEKAKEEKAEKAKEEKAEKATKVESSKSDNGKANDAKRLKAKVDIDDNANTEAEKVNCTTAEIARSDNGKANDAKRQNAKVDIADNAKVKPEKAANSTKAENAKPDSKKVKEAEAQEVDYDFIQSSLGDQRNNYWIMLIGTLQYHRFDCKFFVIMIDDDLYMNWAEFANSVDNAEVLFERGRDLRGHIYLPTEALSYKLRSHSASHIVCSSALGPWIPVKMLRAIYWASIGKSKHTFFPKTFSKLKKLFVDEVPTGSFQDFMLIQKQKKN